MAELGGEKEEGEVAAVVDFDMLCATVAMQTQGLSAEKRLIYGGEEADEEDEEREFTGVQRMWEGNVLDCFDDRRIAVEAACCPCYRFGKNMRRANLGPCFLQGTIYSVLLICILVNYITFLVTKRRCFFLMSIASTVSFGLYAGYFRTRIRKLFNIKPSNSLLVIDDYIHHQICPCCTLCQESRTLEMNNVHEGVWHGRGDTICIGTTSEGSKLLSSFGDNKPTCLLPTKMPQPCSMDRVPNSKNSSSNSDITQSEPLV